LLLRGFTPDIIICYISCNDWGNSPNVPIGIWAVTDPIPAEGNKTTLREAYALMINKLHTAYPNARVFCCTNLDDMLRDSTPGWPSNNSLGVSTYEWNQNIIEVAHALGCDVIDLNHCGLNYANITQFAVDAGLHPNDAGHTMIARKVIAELYAKY
jgi:lysophospholipase L1-like esterase